MKKMMLTIRWWQFVLPAMIFLTLFSCKEDSVDPLEGSFIVFNSFDINDHFDLVKMDYQSRAFTFLTNTPVDESHPDISPDRSKIVFIKDDGNDLEVFAMDADGGGITQLTSNDTDDINPKWNDSGDKIVFSSMRSGNGDIYMMNADGSGQERLTDLVGRERDPDIHPDGSVVVFEYRDGSSYDIVSLEIGTGVYSYLTSNGDSFDPNISPDGSMIAFSSLISGDDEIFYMNMDASGMTQVTFNDVSDYRPYWAPDNDHLVYSSNTSTLESNLYIIRKDGLGNEQITQFAGLESSSSWR